MKKLIWGMLILSLGLLTSCGLNQNLTNQQAEQQKRSELIKKNRKVWNKRIKSAKDVNDPNYDKEILKIPSGYDDSTMSLQRLKDGNQNVIVGQVLNLQPEFGRKVVTETKGTVYVQNVISGDKSLKGRTIKTEFSGGLAKSEDYFRSLDGDFVGSQFGVPNPKTIVYSSIATKPIPKIGSKFIAGIKLYSPDNKTQQATYKKYGLTTKNFYVLENPEVTFWIKKDNEYKINNPAFYLPKNRSKVRNILKLTNKLNEQN